ncbi:cyclase family protein [Fodinisporobacter ferrooxydans]|uniref:Cyclase family protein n=1 Tax=Fodinisporobacter ferrooxydans TaxID=2901836 RepID=A0ABY4CTZ5_9BACL|nr:cyclase family protein [Alicyclobacillaceae bacterium MYW30-H2]
MLANQFQEFWQTLCQDYKIIDLSHKLEEHMPQWPTHSRFFHTLWDSYWHGDVAIDYQIMMNEHTGTHMDAPAHFIQAGESNLWIDEVPLEQTLGTCVRIEMRHIAPKGLVPASAIMEWEKTYGKIQSGEIVLFDYDWAKFWNKRPNDRKYTTDWPGLSREAAELLVERGAKLVGCDTLAIDTYGHEENPAHYVLLGNKVLICENLHQLWQIPPRGGYFIALPLPIKKGSASPVRAICIVPKTEQQKQMIEECV